MKNILFVLLSLQAFLSFAYAMDEEISPMSRSPSPSTQVPEILEIEGRNDAIVPPSTSIEQQCENLLVSYLAAERYATLSLIRPIITNAKSKEELLHKIEEMQPFVNTFLKELLTVDRLGPLDAALMLSSEDLNSREPGLHTYLPRLFIEGMDDHTYACLLEGALHLEPRDLKDCSYVIQYFSASFFNNMNLRQRGTLSRALLEFDSHQLICIGNNAKAFFDEGRMALAIQLAILRKFKELALHPQHIDFFGGALTAIITEERSLPPNPNSYAHVIEVIDWWIAADMLPEIRE